MTAPVIHMNIIQTTFFQFIQAYRAIINPVNHITKALPKSGIKMNINSEITFMTTNERINWLSLSIDFLFLINHHDINKTYHSLKNSEGWILGKNGISNHHLAQFISTHIQGTKTSICSINTITVIITIFLCFWKKRIGIL